MERYSGEVDHSFGRSLRQVPSEDINHHDQALRLFFGSCAREDEGTGSYGVERSGKTSTWCSFSVTRPISILRISRHKESRELEAPDTGVAKAGAKGVAELGVSIVNQKASVLEETPIGCGLVSRDLLHELGVGIGSDAGNSNYPRFRWMKKRT